MVNVSVAPFQVGSGERCGTILILDDVTARMRLEEQLQHSEKMASIGLLAAGVAHEVNTPLTGISSYTQMLREQVEADDPRAAAPGEDREADLPRGQDHQQPAELLAVRAAASWRPWTSTRCCSTCSRCSSTSSTGPASRCARSWRTNLPAGARQREPPAAGLLQPDPERRATPCPAGGWLTLATRADDDTVVVEVADTGHGHQARGHQAHLRSLLHHQGHRPRHRPRPLRLLRHRAGARRRHLRGQRARPGHHLPGRPARRCGRRKRRRSASGDRSREPRHDPRHRRRGGDAGRPADPPRPRRATA